MRSLRDIVAQPVGALLLSANRRADRLNRNTPPVRPCASRAIQKPSLLRLMKNSGMDSLRTPLFGRCGKFATATLRVNEPPRRLTSKLMILSHAYLARVSNVTPVT